MVSFSAFCLGISSDDVRGLGRERNFTDLVFIQRCVNFPVVSVLTGHKITHLSYGKQILKEDITKGLFSELCSYIIPVVLHVPCYRREKSNQRVGTQHEEVSISAQSLSPS